MYARLQEGRGSGEFPTALISVLFYLIFLLLLVILQVLESSMSVMEDILGEVIAVRHATCGKGRAGGLNTH